MTKCVTGSRLTSFMVMVVRGMITDHGIVERLYYNSETWKTDVKTLSLLQVLTSVVRVKGYL